MSKNLQEEKQESLVYEVQIMTQEEIQLVRVRCHYLDLTDGGDILFYINENTLTAMFSSSVLIAFYLVDEDTGEPTSVIDLNQEEGEDESDEEGLAELDFS